MEIKGFQDKYRFLSNFFPCEVSWEGRKYLSSEAAYQASKTTNDSLRDRFTILNAREARSAGQVLTILDNWEDIKLNIMYKILRVKFMPEPLRGMLLSTDDSYLEETNYWYDTFWGIFNGRGENHLGRLLMLVRDELKEEII